MSLRNDLGWKGRWHTDLKAGSLLEVGTVSVMVLGQMCHEVMRSRCGEPERDRVEMNLERTKEHTWCVCVGGSLQVLGLEGTI